MSTARAKNCSAFTLLEISLAVAILALMSLSVYRFVQTNLTVMRIANDEQIADARYNGLINLLTAQWQSLPAGSGALVGEPLKLNDVPRDEITWTCSAGPGVLTRYASGDYTVGLRLRPVAKDSNTLELGIARKMKTSDSDQTKESWVPLINDVRSLEIRYFDPRLNSWVERWTDTITLPRLVRIVIGRPDRPIPLEAIVALGRTPL